MDKCAICPISSRLYEVGKKMLCSDCVTKHFQTHASYKASVEETKPLKRIKNMGIKNTSFFNILTPDDPRILAAVLKNPDLMGDDQTLWPNVDYDKLDAKRKWIRTKLQTLTLRQAKVFDHPPLSQDSSRLLLKYEGHLE